MVVVVVAEGEGEGVVVDNMSEHMMADKLASVEGEVASLRGAGSSFGHRLERRLACTLEDKGVGVGVAQVVGEVWRDRVRSGDVVPSALGLEDECKVEDTLVQLYMKEKTNLKVNFVSKIKC